jgi:hypothetical protein
MALLLTAAKTTIKRVLDDKYHEGCVANKPIDIQKS